MEIQNAVAHFETEQDHDTFHNYLYFSFTFFHHFLAGSMELSLSAIEFNLIELNYNQLYGFVKESLTTTYNIATFIL